MEGGGRREEVNRVCIRIEKMEGGQTTIKSCIYLFVISLSS